VVRVISRGWQVKSVSRDCESGGCGLHQHGRVALITGGSRGIGRAIAVRLAKANCHIVVNYFRQRKAAEEVAEEVRAAGMKALIVKANVANEKAVADMFRQIREEFGQLDILVSNAASGVLKPALELTERHWHWTMDINAGTMIPLARHAVPLMEGRRGHIIAVSSLGAIRALPNYTAVGASKAALESLVRHLAVELAPRGVRVNCVSAGVVDTDALKHFPNRDELIGSAKERTPSGRLTTPDDVADVILFLCNRCTDQIVGQTIIVDGGYSILG
jgi:enoyl-[acyl-carrier protein] reductase III